VVQHEGSHEDRQSTDQRDESKDELHEMEWEDVRLQRDHDYSLTSLTWIVGSALV
jgi:hypothetical protein